MVTTIGQGASSGAEYPGATAAVPWYGHVKRVYKDAPGVDAFAVAPKIKAPVLGLYGAADSGIPTPDVKAFEAELRKTNPNVEFVLYPDAPHAFFSDDRPQVYKKEAVEAVPRVLRQAPQGVIARYRRKSASRSRWGTG